MKPFKSDYPFHETHCCHKHGCKYQEDDCPVVSGVIAQSYPCESCIGEGEDPPSQEQELEELRHYRRDHERLKKELNAILHPDGGGPKAPMFCDLIAYVRGDLSKQREKIKELEEYIGYLEVQLETEDI